MFGLKSKNLDNENIKNPPSDDAYPLVAPLFANRMFSNHEITYRALSLTILDLINKGQIKCDIDIDDSHIVGKKFTESDLEVMKRITLRIANRGELKTSESAAINLLKTMNKAKKFTLKDMAKKSNNSSIANKFEVDFIEFAKALKNENEFTADDYKDILNGGSLTSKGKDLKNQWKDFQEYLKSKELTQKYPPVSAEENSSQIIYAACFDIEKDALALRENDSTLTDFIDKDGYKLLNIIFNNALSNVTEKRKGDGIFYGVNDKYSIPGGA